ncbi:hypothetical protein M758_2G069500 [Ceratodon purpureus]|nr:hypothetical protein M758_2G069500 [Ceratodon purpureus]
MIEFLIFLLLLNGEASCAMGRALLESSSNVTQPALISPVSPKHPRPNHSLVAVIVVLMVLATVALICCCYMWERQLRLRIEAARSSTHSLQVPVGDNHSSRPQMGSSPSVIVLLGDDLTRSVAWAVPRRIPASVAAEAANQPTPTHADQALTKLAPK